MCVSTRVLLLLVLCVIQQAVAVKEPTEDGGCAKEKTCDFNDCKDGEECYLLNGEPTCRPFEPTEDGGCAKEKTCDFNDCKDGEECYLLNGEPTCRPCSSTCEGVVCPEGQECILEVVQCFVPPCCPIPTCTPTNNSSSCPEEERQTCDGIDCGKQKECIILDGIPTCVQELTCATINCIAGYTCVDRKCILDPCYDYQCPYGQECHLEDVPCTEPPCRVPSCRPIDKCATVSCKQRYICQDGKCVEEVNKVSVDGELGLGWSLKDVPGLVSLAPTCRGYECPPGEECYLEEVVCVKAPCFPIPSCRPRACSPSSPCTYGRVCINGRCVTRATCQDFECPPGQECYLVESSCRRPPCPPVPSCRPPPTCDVIHCPPGYLCSKGRCIPGPSSKG
ncbi:keratin-associated protein 16-1-like [Homalodisca vitripennis]|uniref:keratin-associated protein 16-1-like n=1 Tax=Homalodisca vitripennis TaxID=197043 RepID=UPI001EEC1025|nr:keratin-associated protein 16-1-like [Homalodisca vitripennis]